MNEMPKISDLVNEKEPEGESAPTERSLPNWLFAYAKYTENSESPETYHLWVALWCLSSAIRKNVWLDMGIFTLYPNLYVILTGEAGKMAKSTCVSLGATILRGVDEIKFAPDAVTAEELVDRLDKAYNGKQSAIAIKSTELSDLIDPSGIKMVSWLTTIYDSQGFWDRGTKRSGKNEIKNPVVNLLAGTTPEWLADGLPVQAIGHGFTSRCVFVYEDNLRDDQPFPEPADRELVRRLIDDLNHISKITGEFLWDSGEGEQPGTEDAPWSGWKPEMGLEKPGWRISAKHVYAYYYSLIKRTPARDYRLRTYHHRKRTHVLKVAMLVSLAERDDLILTGRDIVASWRIFDLTEAKMANAFSSVGKYQHASDLERILKDIQDRGGMSIEEIYSENRAAADEQELSRILNMLLVMKKIERAKVDGRVIYRPFGASTAE